MPQSYQYRNQVLHVECTRETLSQEFHIKPPSADTNVEVYLDIVARFRGIHRRDTNSFNQSEFPKPHEVTETTTCPYCLKLIEANQEAT